MVVVINSLELQGAFPLTARLGTGKFVVAGAPFLGEQRPVDCCRGQADPHTNG